MQLTKIDIVNIYCWEIRHFLTAWHQITNDSIMLEVIKNGLKRYQDWFLRDIKNKKVVPNSHIREKKSKLYFFKMSHS